MDTKQHARLFADGVFVVRKVRAIGGADFAEDRATLLHDLRDSESIADFNQFSARDDDFAAASQRCACVNPRAPRAQPRPPGCGPRVSKAPPASAERAIRLLTESAAAILPVLPKLFSCSPLPFAHFNTVRTRGQCRWPSRASMSGRNLARPSVELLRHSRIAAAR